MQTTSRYQGQDMRRVLAGMVTDRVVCVSIADQWRDDGLFDVPWANLVGGWCVDYVRQYGEAPNGQLQSLFEQWADGRSMDPDTVTGIERFLSFVSDEWTREDPPCSDYLLNLAGSHFNRVAVHKAVEQAAEDLEGNRVADAMARLTSFGGVEVGVGRCVKLAEEFEPWQMMLDEDRQKPLLHWPGLLGMELDATFTRGSLVGFMAPDKAGKSFWLMETAIRAIKARRRVAYFEVGDLQQDEVLLRIGSRVTMRPIRDRVIQYPTRIFRKDGEVIVERETRKLLAISPGECFKAFRRLCRGRDLCRLECYPSGTISVDGVQVVLRKWERTGWVADVVVIDYADILAPPNGVRETLDQIDETWKRLHRFSQEMQCLVVTASQSSAAAYAEKEQTLGRKHFSGRKTKLAHVNGMLGINATDKEKEQGITRLNWIVRRNAGFSSYRAVTVAGCLDISSPLILVLGKPKESEKSE